MDMRATVGMLHAGFDVRRCMALLEGIWENDRFFTNRAFLKTADFCMRAMEKAGLSQIERLDVPADGRTPSGDWVIPRAWDVDYARLTDTSGGRVLADYASTPCSLLMYSAPTPPGGVTASVIDMDAQQGMDEARLRGKLLLTGRPAKELVALARRAGAAGILSDYMPMFPGVRESRAEMAAYSRWDNDFIAPINDTGLFGFSLSPANGDWLRARLRADPFLLLHAQVNTVFHDGTCPTVSGCIPGTDAQAGEVFIYGHLYEQGANDNASGCAVALALAHFWAEAIRDGRLAPPRRTIRLIMGYECAGSAAYFVRHSGSGGRKTVCGTVADMVGTGAVDRVPLCIWRGPASGLSFAEVLMEESAACWRAYTGTEETVRLRPFTVGTDNVLADPCWGMPVVSMVNEPALSYHSSMDVPARIEPDVLRRSGAILGAYVWHAANLGAQHAQTLWEMSVESLRRGLPACADGAQAAYLKHEAARGAAQALASFLGEECALPDDAAAQLHPCHTPAPDWAGAGAGRVPVRCVPGCLTLAANPALREAPWQPAWSDRLNLPLFWADGVRTMWDIAVLSAAEQGGAPDMKAHWADISSYFDFLSENGYISYR